MGKLVRALSADGSVLCSSVDATDICNEIVRIHQPSPVATAAMGRLAAAGSLMGALMKGEDDALTLRINGGGAGGTVLCVADYMGNVRCCCDNPQADLPLKENGKLDVGGFVGKDGFLAIIRDLGLKEPYATQSPIVSGEIAEDITAYYAISEQIPTVCALGVLVDRDHSVKAAGGYIIQLVPPVNEAAIDFIEKNIKNMQSVTTLLSEGKTAEEIALMGLEGLQGEILDSWECGYKCRCSRERTERMLISLGKKELVQLAEESEDSGDNTEICCQFCGKKYYFSKEDLTELAENC
ncbi:MAG: Hsp33 family molecular chaperone HslO [Ruminiclostridium sp.]|nr:Hsp33 family molecular chaperone HslO [Ruminiclostridium sp.]